MVGLEDHSSNPSCSQTNRQHIVTYTGIGHAFAVKVGLNISSYPDNKLKVDHKFVVDTGASCCLVNKAVYDQLPDEVRPVLQPTDVNIEGVGSQILETYGTARFELQLGGVFFHHDMIVCDLVDDGIIGSDFMESHCASVNYKPLTLKLDDHTIPMFRYRRNNPIVALCTVRRTLLAPGEECILKAKVKGPVNLDSDYIVSSPNNVNYDVSVTENVAVANSMSTIRDGQMMVRIANLSHSKLTLPKGEVIAQCSPAKVISQIAESERSSPSTDDVKSGVSTGIKHSRHRVKKTTNLRVRQAAAEPHLSGIPEHLQDHYMKSITHLNSSQRKILRNFLIDNADVYSSGKKDLGHTHLVKHDIDTQGHTPVRQRMRHQPLAKQSIEDELVDEMLDQEVIEPSKSPWASPIVLAKKKDGSTRFCVDYRKLNLITKKDAYPLPRVDDCLSSLNGAQYFCTLDLTAGYWHVGLTDRAKERSAFICRKGLFQWNVMPFGLCGAPATFERLMETVLHGLQWQTCLLYLDDIIIFGHTFEETMARLKEVVHRLRQAGMKLKPKKCVLFQKSVQFLGHVVSADGIRTDPEKVRAISEWPIPRHGLKEGRRSIPFVTQVRSFLGICSYYRRFIPNLAKIAEPLQRYTRDGADLEWTTEANNAFNSLKEKLITAPVLRYPDLSKPFIVDSDACDYALGAVLSQVDERDGREHPVAYMSSTFSDAERHYCTWRKELMAVYRAIKHFEPYIYGRSIKIRTDNSAVRCLMNSPDLNAQTASIIAYIQSLDMTIEHVRGSTHKAADALSRQLIKEHRCHQCTPKRDYTHFTDATTQVNLFQDAPDNSTEFVHRVQTRSATKADDSTNNDDEVLEPEWKSNEWSHDDLLQAVNKDADLVNFIDLLKKSGKKPPWQEVSPRSPTFKVLWSEWDRLLLKDGLLFRKRIDKDGSLKSWQLVVPCKLRRSIFDMCHGTPFGGHLGSRKTLGKIRTRFFWPRCSEDVKVWVQQCDNCTANKPLLRHTHARLQVYTVGVPGERSACDVMGPLPLTPRKNKYIFVVGDYFTRWVEAIPVPDETAETLARALVHHYIAKFGVPLSLHSDQGRSFESKLWTELHNILGITKTRTTPYRPQSDGFIERFNRTLGHMLRAAIAENRQDWDDLVPILSMAYRASVNETTGFTPNMLMLGREVLLPIDLVVPRILDDETTLPDFVAKLRETMEKVHDEVREHTSWSVQRQKRLYDLRAKDRCLQVGQLVWYNLPPQKTGTAARKLRCRRQGPFAVMAKLDDVRYVIKKGPKQKPMKVHVDYLLPYMGQKKLRWVHRELDLLPKSIATQTV